MLLRTAFLLALVAVPSARAQGTTTILPDADCVMADSNGVNHFFMNGESFGTLTASYPCGSTSEFPCYCDTSQSNGIRCPYCMFPTSGNGVVCAQNGGDVTFTNPFGSQQTCDCQWLTGTSFNSNCSSSNPAPAPTQGVCTLQQNTDQCATLTQGKTFPSDCECAAFCNGALMGCCAFGASCTVNCFGGLDDIVGGCPIDSQGSDVVDSPDPTPAPVTLPTTSPVAPTMPVTAFPTVTPTSPTSLPMDTVSAMPSDFQGDDECLAQCLSTCSSGMTSDLPSNMPTVFLENQESTAPDDKGKKPSEVQAEQARVSYAPAGPPLMLLSCLCVQLAFSLL